MLGIFPLAVAIEFWIDRVRHRRDAAMASSIKMSTNVPLMQRALARTASFIFQDPCAKWFARAPSSSNLADAPSRLERLALYDEVARKRRIDLAWLEW